MNLTFSPTTAVPVGQNVTATAKAINIDASNGDTSEFSAPRKVTYLFLEEAPRSTGPTG
jgi:hypothetical protein